MNVHDPLTRLERAQLVHASAELPPAYSFKHALVQDLVYMTLLKHERRRLHQRVAEYLQAVNPSRSDALSATLAEHFWAAENWDAAATYALRAGNNSLRVYALREALSYYERALAALDQLAAPDPLRVYDALMGWADAAIKFRPFAEQLDRVHRAESIARSLGDKPRLARALYKLGGIHTAEGHNLRAIQPLNECFTLADELHDERLLPKPTYFAGMASLDTNPRGAAALFDRAIELAHRYEDTDSEAVAGSAKAWALARLGDFSNARAAIARAQSLLPDVKSPMAASDVDLFAGWASLEMYDTEQGLFYGERGVERARAAENMDCLCGAYLCVGFNQLTARRPALAQDAFYQAISESHDSGSDIFENLGRVGLALAQFYGGSADAVGILEQARARALDLADEYTFALVSQSVGEIYAQRGENELAEARLNEALAFFRRSEMTPSLARTLELLSEVYAQAGRVEETEAARAEVGKWKQLLAQESNQAILANSAL